MADQEDGIWVLGGGGHAKVVIATMIAAGLRPAGVFDDDPLRHGSSLLGVPVIGALPEPSELGGRSAVIAIGSNQARRRIAGRYPGVCWATIAHPRAVLHESCAIGPGSVLFANAVVQPDSRVGAHVIVNTGAQIDHDGNIGDFCHLAPASSLGGGVRLGEGVFLGVGCAVIPYVAVGDWTIVGAGAAVVRELPAGVIAVGAPARPIKRNAAAPS